MYLIQFTWTVTNAFGIYADFEIINYKFKTYTLESIMLKKLLSKIRYLLNMYEKDIRFLVVLNILNEKR